MIGHSQFWTTQYHALLFYYQITELAAFSAFSKEYPNLKGNYFFVWYADGLTPEKHILCTETEPDENKLHELLECEHIANINSLWAVHSKFNNNKYWRELALCEGSIIRYANYNKKNYRLQIDNIFFLEDSLNAKITVSDYDNELFKYLFVCILIARPNENEFSKVEIQIYNSFYEECERYLKRQEQERFNEIEKNKFFSRKVEMKKENAKQLTLF